MTTILRTWASMGAATIVLASLTGCEVGSCADSQHSPRSIILTQAEGAFLLSEAQGLGSITLHAVVSRGESGPAVHSEAVLIESDTGGYWFDDPFHGCPDEPTDECNAGFPGPRDTTCGFYVARLTLSIEDLKLPPLEFEVPPAPADGETGRDFTGVSPVCVWDGYCFDANIYRI